MRLVSICFSHYSERARWALNRFAVPHEERGYLPLFHFAGVIGAVGFSGGQADRASTRFSTPLLVCDDGTQVRDSQQIVQLVSERYGFAATSLYPEEHREEIEAIESRVQLTLGPDTRRIAYFSLLQDKAAMSSIVRGNVGSAQAGMFMALFPLLRIMLRRVLGIDAHRTEASKRRVAEHLKDLGEILGDRPYFVGDRFTAADLTVASMVSPVVLPPEYGAHLPGLETLSPDYTQYVQECRDTPIGRYVLRMFAEERSVTVAPTRPDDAQPMV